MPPEHYEKKALQSRIKAVAVVEKVRIIERSKKSTYKEILFRRIHSFTPETHGTFKGTCYSVDHPQQDPGVGGIIYFYPEEGKRGSTVFLLTNQIYAILFNMERIVGISEAAEVLGVSVTTLRRWEASGKLVAEHTAGGHRRYDIAVLRPELFRATEAAKRKTIAYARVLSHDQKNDLERQKQVLEIYCARQGWTFEVVADLGSGMNYRKKGLKRLLSGILDGQVGRLVIVHKDRLLRFGAELVFAICEAKNVEIVILNQGEDTTFEEDLAKDVLEIITVFSARLYGSRSRKNQKLLDGVKHAVEESQK